MDEFMTQTLSGSSDEDSSEDDQEVSQKRRRSTISTEGLSVESQGTQSSDDSNPPQKRRRRSDESTGGGFGFDPEGLLQSSDEETKRPRKRHKTFISGLGYESQALSDNGSSEHSPTGDHFHYQLNDEDKNLASKMVKEAKPQAFMDNRAKKMMERMGYKEGLGLGKHEQGRVDPVEMSRQRGRRGLGLKVEGLEAATLEWNSDLEVVSVEETVKWLEDSDYQHIPFSVLNTWKVVGPRKLVIDDETNFCDPNLLRNVLNSKSVFDKLEADEMLKARSRSNPFETIRGAIFLNRAAVKMANMDRVFDFMFTNPKAENGASVLGPYDLLYFADVCAGPGGFSEYVLWRKKWRCKGFGFTLKGENDFRLADFFAGSSETFEPFYGKGGIEGDGNVFNPENITEFKKFVYHQTSDKGVHFMMADGGFSVEGQENIQEILSKQLYLCQCLVALSIVRTGGHFVCKLFDIFTPFSVGLVYLMYKSFKKISIHKPNTSRPANSERYIICKWKRNDCDDICDYLFQINLHLWNHKTDTDVTEIVPLSVLTEDEAFFNYIVESNNSLGERQVVNLVKIAAFCRDTTLSEPRQPEIRRQCLRYWDVPDKSRTAPARVSPDQKCQELLKASDLGAGFMTEKATELLPNTLDHTIKSIYDWHCAVLTNNRENCSLTFYLGVGRGRVYRWDAPRWRCDETGIELSPDTLVVAEAVTEMRGESRSQRKMATLHIVDAICLGGTDVSSLHITERHKYCDMFAAALYKPSRMDNVQVRAKTLYELENIHMVFDNLDLRLIKSSGGQKRLVFKLEDNDRFFLPGGLLFYRATKDPWMRHCSKGTGHKYYASSRRKDSLYDKDRPPEACASAQLCYQKRLIWFWEEGVQVHDLHTIKNDRKLQRNMLLDFVQAKTVSPKIVC